MTMSDVEGATRKVEPLSQVCLSVSELEQTFDLFADDLRAACRSSTARDAIDFLPAKEAEVWLGQQSTESELCSYALCGGSDELDGLVCASICLNGRHARHREGSPMVDWAFTEQVSNTFDSRSAQLQADVIIWHLWVRSSARGQGVADRLLASVWDHAHVSVDAHSTARVSAEVLQSNAAALRFWRRLLPNQREQLQDDGYVRITSEPWLRPESSASNSLRENPSLKRMLGYKPMSSVTASPRKTSSMKRMMGYKSF